MTVGLHSSPGSRITLPGCEVRRAINQNTNNGVFTALIFDTQIRDTDEMWEGAVNPTRVTFRTPGVYHIAMCMQWIGTAPIGALRAAGFRLNGATYMAQYYGTPVTGANTVISISQNRLFAKNDYIEVMAYQNSGGVRAIVAGNGPLYCWATMIR